MTTAEHTSPSIERLTMTEHIWRGAIALVQRRVEEAVDGASDVSLETIDTACNRQCGLLEKANLDDLTTSQITANYLASFILSIPSYADAQQELARPGMLTPKQKEQYKHATIRSNQLLGNALTYMPAAMFDGLIERLERLSQNLIGKKWALPTLEMSDIRICVRGQQGEAAVRRAINAHKDEESGWSVRPGTKAEDASGGDVVIIVPPREPIYVDLKTERGFAQALDKIAAADPGMDLSHVNNALFLRDTAHTGQLRRRCIVNIGQFGPITGLDFSPDGQQQVVDFMRTCVNDKTWENAVLTRRARRTLGASALLRS